MRKECSYTVEWMQSVSKSDRKQQADEYQLCTRGLEEMTPLGQKRKHRNKKIAWTAVFSEQERQRSEGLNDPALLSDVYFLSSFQCLEKYFIRAV